jgi:hypothetical protein
MARTAQKTPPTVPPLLLADSSGDGSGIVSCLHICCLAMAVPLAPLFQLSHLVSKYIFIQLHVLRYYTLLVDCLLLCAVDK